MIRFLSISFIVMFLSACAGTVPAEYTAQSYIKVGEGQMRMGDFNYVPSTVGKVKNNQIQNTAIGNIYMSSNVADMVKRATALEFERSGLTVIDSANKEVRADIIEFKADDLGFSVDWTFKVKYAFYDLETNQQLFSKEYESDRKKTGKFGLPSDYTPSINEMIRNALEKFMRDIRDIKTYASVE